MGDGRWDGCGIWGGLVGNTVQTSAAEIHSCLISEMGGGVLDYIIIIIIMIIRHLHARGFIFFLAFCLLPIFLSCSLGTTRRSAGKPGLSCPAVWLGWLAANAHVLLLLMPCSPEGNARYYHAVGRLLMHGGGIEW
jgi:hypothetical protein